MPSIKDYVDVPHKEQIHEEIIKTEEVKDENDNETIDTSKQSSPK